MNSLTPKEIVSELDRYIVAQAGAKRAVAIALRNRWRRQQVEGTMRNEIVPNNIILIIIHRQFGHPNDIGNKKVLSLFGTNKQTDIEHDFFSPLHKKPFGATTMYLLKVLVTRERGRQTA